jgi:hypothetical protein
VTCVASCPEQDRRRQHLIRIRRSPPKLLTITQRTMSEPHRRPVYTYRGHRRNSFIPLDEPEKIELVRASFLEPTPFPLCVCGADRLSDRRRAWSVESSPEDVRGCLPTSSSSSLPVRDKGQGTQLSSPSPFLPQTALLNLGQAAVILKVFDYRFFGSKPPSPSPLLPSRISSLTIAADANKASSSARSRHPLRRDLCPPHPRLVPKGKME